MGGVVQLILHSGILSEEISENDVVLSSTMLSFTVFLPIIVLSDVEAEHNSFQGVLETQGGMKTPANALELLLPSEVRGDHLSQSKDGEVGPMRSSFTSDTLWY